MISVIFPAYNEEDNVEELHFKLKKVLDSMGEEYEIIGVDNGSTDATLKRLKTLSPIKIVVIAGNMGQTPGLDAGIRNAEGDIIVFIDADLQNDPNDIPKLVSKLKEGYDIISGWRVDRNDKLIRRVVSRIANWVTYKMTGLYLHDYGCALKAYRKDILGGVVLYGETHAFLSAILFMKGAKISEVPIKHYKRKAGISKISIWKLFKNIADLAAVRFLYHSMSRPLVFFGGWGLVSVVLGFVTGLIALVLKFMRIRNLAQTPLPILASLFVIMGFILFMWGFLGEMIARLYFEDKNKTPYIIREVIKK